VEELGDRQVAGAEIGDQLIVDLVAEVCTRRSAVSTRDGAWARAGGADGGGARPAEQLGAAAVDLVEAR
jgi:hypothetical protein